MLYKVHEKRKESCDSYCFNCVSVQTRDSTKLRCSLLTDKNVAGFAVSGDVTGHYINTGLGIFRRLQNAGSDFRTKTYYNS